MKARRNGPGSNDAPAPCGNDRLFGKFLAKLVSLKGDFQQVSGATFACE